MAGNLLAGIHVPHIRYQSEKRQTMTMHTPPKPMKLLVAGAWQPNEAQLDALESMGHRIYLHPREDAPLSPAAHEVEGVIANGLFLHHPIASFEALRYVQLTSVGCERVPMAYVWQKGITLHTASGVYAAPMAEFAVGALLGLYKEWGYFREGQAACRWQKNRGLREVGGKRICIVGCGHVGDACAARLQAFGCSVVGVTAHPREDARYEVQHPPEALLQAMEAADVVILSLPLTRETHHMIGHRELACLREGGILINLSRGGIVDTAALMDILRARPDLAAVLDVQETEPLPSDSPLWRMENVYITPHNSFVGDRNAERLWRLILANLRGYMGGTSP